MRTVMLAMRGGICCTVQEDGGDRYNKAMDVRAIGLNNVQCLPLLYSL